MNFATAINANPSDLDLQRRYSADLEQILDPRARGWRRLVESPEHRPEHLIIGIVSWTKKWVWWNTLPGGGRLGPSWRFSWDTFFDAMDAAAVALARINT